jgi:cytoskeletal protein CcmA (bactofilin family)
MAEITGEIGQSARIFAGNTVINGKIGEDLVVVGGTLRINKDAVIKGDLLLLAGQVVIDGKIEGGIVSPGAGDIIINGSVGKNAEIGEVSRLTIGDGASIGGKLIYSGNKEGAISGTAKIGSIEFKKVVKNMSFYGISLSALLFRIIGIFIALLILLYFIPKTTSLFVKKSLAKPMSSFWWGFISIIVIPIIAILLLISMLGARIGIVILFVYPILLILAEVLSCLLVGSLLLKQGKNHLVNWKSALLGTLVTGVLSVIPIVGSIFVMIFFMISSGQLLQMFVEKINLQRK